MFNLQWYKAETSCIYGAIKCLALMFEKWIKHFIIIVVTSFSINLLSSALNIWCEVVNGFCSQHFLLMVINGIDQRPVCISVFKTIQKVCGRATSPAANSVPALPAIDWETFQVRCWSSVAPHFRLTDATGMAVIKLTSKNSFPCWFKGFGHNLLFTLLYQSRHRCPWCQTDFSDWINSL